MQYYLINTISIYFHVLINLRNKIYTIWKIFSIAIFTQPLVFSCYKAFSIFYYSSCLECISEVFTSVYSSVSFTFTRLHFVPLGLCSVNSLLFFDLMNISTQPEQFLKRTTPLLKRKIWSPFIHMAFWPLHYFWTIIDQNISMIFIF